MKWSLFILLFACSGAKTTETASEAILETSSEVSPEPSSEETEILVYINELVAKSDVTEDWLELYNAADVAVDISGFTLEDSGGIPWALPEGTEIEADGFLLIWADDGVEGEGLHAPFKLSKDGEEVILRDPTGSLVDDVISPELLAEEAYARVTDGADEWSIRSAGTPGASND